MTTAQKYAQAMKEVLRRYPDIQPDELADEIETVMHEWLAEAAYDRENGFDGVEELEGIPNCDDWGTGEGRYFGRM